MRKLVSLIATTLLAAGLAGCPKKEEAAAPAKATAPVTKTEAEAEAKAPESQPVPISFAEKPALGTVAKCAVTGETFTVDEETVFGEHEGRFYPYCCPSCDEDFKKDPAKYAEKK